MPCTGYLSSNKLAQVRFQRERGSVCVFLFFANFTYLIRSSLRAEFFQIEKTNNYFLLGRKNKMISYINILKMKMHVFPNKMSLYDCDKYSLHVLNNT